MRFILSAVLCFLSFGYVSTFSRSHRFHSACSSDFAGHLRDERLCEEKKHAALSKRKGCCWEFVTALRRSLGEPFFWRRLPVRASLKVKKSEYGIKPHKKNLLLTVHIWWYFFSLFLLGCPGVQAAKIKTGRGKENAASRFFA